VGKSLCGRRQCSQLCSRVEHCPAGQERVRWLAFFKKYSHVRSLKPEHLVRKSGYLVNPETGEIIEDANHYGALNQPERRSQKRVFTPRNEKQAGVPYTRNLKTLVYWPFAVLCATVLLVVVCYGLVVNGPSLVQPVRADPPGYTHYE